MSIHAHRYVYPPPNGPTSQGRCRCGDKKLGLNSLEAAHRFNGTDRRRHISVAKALGSALAILASTEKHAREV
jgi:hypothetical protein